MNTFTRLNPFFDIFTLKPPATANLKTRQLTLTLSTENSTICLIFKRSHKP